MKIVGENPLVPLSKKWLERSDFLNELGIGMVQEVHKRIADSKQSPDGTPWRPWATSTAKARRRAGASSSLLYNSGDLYRSINYNVTGDKLTISSSVPYAKYLQHGTRNMPARPFLGSGPSEERLTQTLWKKWINI